jgi:hypothetical protein
MKNVILFISAVLILFLLIGVAGATDEKTVFLTSDTIAGENVAVYPTTCDDSFTDGCFSGIVSLPYFFDTINGEEIIECDETCDVGAVTGYVDGFFEAISYSFDTVTGRYVIECTEKCNADGDAVTGYLDGLSEVYSFETITGGYIIKNAATGDVSVVSGLVGAVNGYFSGWAVKIATAIVSDTIDGSVNGME